MPFGITAGIMGATSLGGGIAGSKKANKAGNLLYNTGLQGANMAINNAMAGMQGVNTAASGGAQSVSNAAAGASQMVSQQAAASGAQVSNAAGAAAQGVQQGTAEANNLLQGIFGNISGNLSPYLAAGGTAAGALNAALSPGGALTQQFSFDPTKLTEQPDYQFQLQQGLQAVNRQAAAKGQVLGGGNQKALAQYTSGLTSQGLNDMYNRSLTTFQTNRNNLLQGLMAGINTGQVGTAQYNQAAQNYGNQAAQNTIGSAIYGGNIGYNAAQYGGNLAYNAAQYGGNALQNAAYWGANSGLNAAEFNAQLGQGATQFGANMMMGGAGGKASGMIGGSNALWQGISGAGMAALYPYLMGGAFNGNGWGGVSNGTNIPGYNPAAAIQFPWEEGLMSAGRYSAPQVVPPQAPGGFYNSPMVAY